MDEKLLEFESNFSVLDRYGVDVTAEEFITNPAIGRDNQIKELMLILLTPEKSAILIGKPGIGKTAIVEGLAYRMQRGEVPDALQGYTIINIKTASLLGTMPSGESKVQKMIDELKLREKVILFVDEVHMLIGATDSSSLDFANIFKEGLGRGSIKVIGATTTEEYERYILRDKAFTRRFQKVEVPEPTHDETVQIMMGTYPKFEKQTGRKLKYTRFIQERIMSFLVDITSEYKRVFALGSRYPDVCLTLLKQAFSYTVFDNREYVDIFDIRKAIENSKNIYPDVIKKELPRFDKEFNDIILEEKGEKPVEEWRKDSSPTRYQQEANSIIADFGDKNTSTKKEKPVSIFKNLENTPDMVDRNTINEYRPVKAIFSDKSLHKFAKVGPTAISRGAKEKFYNKTDSKNIDNLLLTSEIGVISKDKPEKSFNYTVSEELKPGGLNDLLLGAPISSTLDAEKPKAPPVVEKYKSDNLMERELDPRSNSLVLEGNVDLGRHKNSSRNPKERKPDYFGLGNVDEMFSQHGNFRSSSEERSEPRRDERRDDRRDMQHEFGSSSKVPNMNSSSLEDSFYENQRPNVVKSNLESLEKFVDTENKLDTIVPSKLFDNTPSTSNNNLESDINMHGKFFADAGSKDEFLFGAPMYARNDEPKKEENKSEKPVDIFGQLITNNIRISGGKIMDNDFSYDHSTGRGGRPIIGDVVNVSSSRNDDGFLERPSLEDSHGLSRELSNDRFYSNSEPVGYNNNESQKKRGFLDSFNQENERKQAPKFNELKIERPKKEVPSQPVSRSSVDLKNNSNNFDLNGVDLNKLQSEMLNLRANNRSNGFVDFNDLNSGKISEAELNQFISVANEKPNSRSLREYNEPKNRPGYVDLTLKENNNDNYFDDFYES